MTKKISINKTLVDVFPPGRFAKMENYLKKWFQAVINQDYGKVLMQIAIIKNVPKITGKLDTLGDLIDKAKSAKNRIEKYNWWLKQKKINKI